MAQRRPKWVARKLTPAWQGRVEEELKEREWTRQEFARQLGCTPGAVTGLLKPGARSSRLVEPTCALLEIPGPEFEDDQDFALWRDLQRLKKHSNVEYQKLVSRARLRAEGLASDKI